MNPILRASCQTVLATVVGATLALSSRADTTPTVNPAPPHSFPAPGTPAAMPSPMPTPANVPAFGPHAPFPGSPSPLNPQAATLPSFLEGVITPAEFQAYIKFQQEANNDPESKELLAQIADLRRQLQKIQGELSSHRAKVLADHPEMKAISFKMQQAMFSHGPMSSLPNGPQASPTHMPVMPAPNPPAPKP